MGKTKTERHGLMRQMRQYHKREEPFNVEIDDNKSLYDWWGSLEDSFSKNKDYLMQLALKLFAITPHVAGSAKKELPYYSIGKSAEEVHEILIDAHLNPDDELFELIDDLPRYYNNVEEEVIGREEEELEIDNILNLDVFVNTLEDIIKDSHDNLEESDNETQQTDTTENNDNDVEWDPVAAADEIMNTM
ncbi:hypothetical protein RclHR1_30120002 [Rhizophagus clarus]|nr:hypothetical protein RclHR1_30120002 [Rhizophagus clarus]